jgi:hypothetical protein
MAMAKAARENPRPEFGKDYGVGWVGFVHAPGALSKGIAYLTRRHKVGGVAVSHAFLVTGADECVEANLPAGVVATRLSEEYLGRPDRRVVFRKPRGLTAAAARRIARRAKAQLGAKFDYGAFVGVGLKGTFLGHLLNTLLSGKPQEWAGKLLHEKGRWICSTLVAYCLGQESRYHGRGSLSLPLGTVDPQTLFEDEEIFEPLPRAKPPARRPRKR